MWESMPNSELVAGVARAQRLTELMSSEIGDDIRQLIVEVANKWFEEMLKGNQTHSALLALQDVINAFDFTMTIGEGMKLELIRRRGGSSNAAAEAAAA